MQAKHKPAFVSFLLAGSISMFGQTAPSAAYRDQVASVAGQPIFASELDKALQAQLWQVRAQEYELRSRGLEDLINQKLLEIEAARRGATPAKVLEDEVDSKVPEPTDGEVEAYYLGQKSRLNRPLDDVRVQLQQSLKQARIEEARHKFYTKLREGSQVAVLLRRPKMDPDPRRLRGNPDAPVTIVEFSDFQCPYCKMAQSTLKQVLEKYSDRVNLSYRDMPLDQIHPNATKAAEAARCAAEQGKFWEYHDALFNSGNFTEKALSDQARRLGLDSAGFDSCLGSGKFRDQVVYDLQMGVRAGVSGTPGFFINGIPLQGSQPIEAFERIIDRELADGSQAITSKQARIREPAQ